ncbi:MAG: hypothetical protein BWY76_03268 [bacterium ADurb.Bin429]|nr:MAG: hypothetical protein BWY76_03268 [bacterium ADurb.Bin429]
MQDAVNAIPHLHALLERLYMHVAGALLHRLPQDEVDQLDNGRFARHRLQVADIVAVFVKHLHVVIGSVGDHAAGVMLLHQPAHVQRIGINELHVSSRHQPDIIGGGGVEGVGDSHAQRCWRR